MLRLTLTLAILLAVSCGSSFAATESWVEVSSPHFVVLTNSSDKQARGVLDQFERMRWLFHALLPKSSADPVDPIEVIAVKDASSMNLLEPEAYLKKGSLTVGGLFLKTTDKNFVLLRLDAEGDHPFAGVYHEYTHFQLRSATEWLPLWLNEGLAEFMQNTEIRDKDVLIGQPIPGAINYLRQNRMVPLATLFKVDAKSPYYHDEEKGSVFYAESWALTHYLRISDLKNGTNRLSDYVMRISHQEDPVEAAEKAFGNLQKLEMTLYAYVEMGNYQEIRFSSAAAPIDESSFKSIALTQAQADAMRAEFLVYMQRTQDAQALVDTALKVDPDNVQALETNGNLASLRGDKEAALRWYERAVKLDSQNYLAHYHYAAESMNQTGTLNFIQIEDDLRTAIRLKPSFAQAYDLLAMVFAMQHKNQDEAHSLNLRAIQLDPGNVSFRLNASMVLMAMSRYEDAASVLRTAEKMAVKASELAMIQERLKQVEAIQAQGASPSAMSTAPPTGVVDINVTDKVFDIDPGPKHPIESTDGPKHTAVGIIRDMKCDSASQLDFHLETTGKLITLHSNNYLKINLTALGFTPKSDMNHCKDFEGMKAQVQYAESSDKTFDGQLVSVELRK
jgi:tetratricopeptide (TPR) repeat protein